MTLNPFRRSQRLKQELAEQQRLFSEQEYQKRQLQQQIVESQRKAAEDQQIREEKQEYARQETAWLEREREDTERNQKARERMRLDKLKETTPEALRGLRDLIRARYELDMDIWCLRGARKPDQHIVLEKMQKADAVLLKIYSMVETWEENQAIWTKQEWMLARDVQQRLLAEGKRWWGDTPPWNEN